MLVPVGSGGSAVDVGGLVRRCSVGPGHQQRLHPQRLNPHRPHGQHHRDGPLHLGPVRPDAVAAAVVIAAVAATPHGRSDAHR